MAVLLRDRAAFVGAVVIAVLVLVAIAAPWLAPTHPHDIDPLNRFAAPSLANPLGTDQIGRDVLSRLIYGARISMVVALVATAGIALIGVLLGLVAGAQGGVVDAAIMRVVDIVLAVPGLLLALVLVGLLGPSLRNLVIAIVAVGWASYARLVRSIVLSVREQPYVEAARAAGAGQWRIMAHHLLPNVAGAAIVLSTLDMGRTLLAVSGLSFLGLGAAPPTPEWGAMLAEAGNYLVSRPLLLVYPGTAITLFVLAFNLLGDGMRDAIDPRMRQRIR